MRRFVSRNYVFIDIRSSKFGDFSVYEIVHIFWRFPVFITSLHVGCRICDGELFVEPIQLDTMTD